MSLLAFGINHKTAPVNIREKVSFAPEAIHDALKQLVSTRGVNEAAILSTCNRTEIYCHVDTGQADEVISWFRDYHQLSADFREFLYIYPDHEAVRHMLRVASGLDSMMLGEPQILGQMKTAFAKASEAGSVGQMLHKLFQHTFSCAKQVRTDTAIGASPVSVAFAAVSLAKQIFDDFPKHTALLLGAGETVELVARHLKENGIGRIIIANRTLERAHALAKEFDAYAIPLSELPAHLSEADMVIASTGSQLPLVGKGMAESAVKARKHRPMFMVDIAVPRDIEPEVSELEDVFLYTVDDLKEIIDEGLKSRREAAQKAEEIVDSQVAHFMAWLRSLSAINTLRQYRQQAETIRQEALSAALKQLENGKEAQAVVEELAHKLTNKLIHTPSVQMKRASSDERFEVLAAARELFNLQDSDE